MTLADKRVDDRLKMIKELYLEGMKWRFDCTNAPDSVWEKLKEMVGLYNLHWELSGTKYTKLRDPKPCQLPHILANVKNLLSGTKRL